MKDRFPIISLNGTSDPSMPAKTLEENQKEWGWIDFRIYEGAGQWLLFEHYKDVLELVAKYVEHNSVDYTNGCSRKVDG
jgi:hypothetical protein